MTNGARDLAAAATGAAGLLRLEPDTTGGAVEGLLQGDLRGVLHVLAPRRPATAKERLEDGLEGAAATAGGPAEQVAQVEGLTEPGALAPGPTRLLERLRLLPLLPVAVVLPALLGVGQHLVGAVNLLEPLLGLLIAGVDIGVVLAGKPAICLPHLLVGGAARDAKDIVVVPASHRSIVGQAAYGVNFR